MIRIISIALCLFLSSVLPVMAKTTIVFIGDSLTSGLGVETNQAYPSLLDTMLKQNGYTEIHIINGSVSGSTSASAFARVKWFQKVKPNIIILALGANDGLRGLPTDQMKNNLSLAIEKAKQFGIKIILAGMEIPTNYGSQYTNSFRQVFQSLAVQYNVPLIPFLLQDVGGHPDLNQADGIHPNPAGHKIIATTVYPYLLESL